VAEILEESLAAAEQHGDDGEMHLVDEPSTKVLPDGGSPAPQQNITVTGSFACCAQSRLDPAIDKMEGGSPLRFDGGTRVVREHEDRVMKRGLCSPPAGPVAVASRPTDRTEHVPTHDGGANAGLPLRHEVVIYSMASAFPAGHLR
jgi:hypothetical protein